LDPVISLGISLSNTINLNSSIREREVSIHLQLHFHLF
jgi:hypothetical protein